MAGQTRKNGSPYDDGYIGPEAYESYTTQQEVMNHLLFYKAIIDDMDSGSKIDEYMDMIASLENGLHVPIRDPFHKSIALTFELVIQNQLNPWNVNLIKFAELYLRRVKGEDSVDFITAGKIMVMAWEILKRQTEEVLANSAVQDDAPADWEVEGAEWMSDDANFDFTTKVLDNPVPPLDETIRRSTEQKVTLFDLVEAFEEARKEVEVQQILETERAKERERLQIERHVAVQGMMHKEDLQEDIKRTWGRIQELDNKDYEFTHIVNKDDREDCVACFVSVLFLSFQGRIRVWQKDFPNGKIMFRKVTDKDQKRDEKEADRIAREIEEDEARMEEVRLKWEEEKAQKRAEREARLAELQAAGGGEGGETPSQEGEGMAELEAEEQE